jgi:TIR domain
MNPPKIFVSYSHDSKEHKAWVVHLSTDLRSNGVDVILDQWDLALGQDVSKFVQTGVASSDRVIMICSEEYVNRADAGVGGVGYERLIITSEVVENIDTKKFIPVIRGNPSSLKVPKFIGPRLYIDFVRDEDYAEKLEEILREIHNSPASAKPPIGTNPFSGSVAPGGAGLRTVGPTGVTPSGVPVLEEAWFAKHATAATAGHGKLGFKGLMEVRFALHSPIKKSQVDLLNAVRSSEIHTFGWPIGVTLENRDEYRPRPLSDGIRAEIAIEKSQMTGQASYDYWALRENGDFYLMQSLFEDDRDPNAIFFNSRLVRVTESLLFAANLYEVLGVPGDTKVSARVLHRGIEGRTLSSSSPRRSVFPRTTQVDESQAELVEETGKLRENIVADVRKITEPLFMLFDFMKFEDRVYEDIVTSFAKGQAT